MQRSQDAWDGVRRLLVVRLDNIGDVVMLSPALRALRQAIPLASVTLMATRAGAQAAPMLPWIDDVMVVKPLWQDISQSMALDPARELSLVSCLRERRFDAAVIFTSFSQSPYPPAFVCYLAGIPVRLGQSREFGGGVLTHWVKPPADDAHQIDRNLHLVESAGLTVPTRRIELCPSKDDQYEADGVLRGAGIDPVEPFLVIAPGASCQARRYEPARYAEVVRRLAEETDLPVVLVGSGNETELAEGILKAAGTARAVSLAGQTSVPVLTALIRRSRLVVANNSAAMHLAEAMDRPMVILYSGTDLVSQWRPRNSPARLLRRATNCQPCYGFHCPYRMECLDVPPEEVVREVLDLLDGTAGREARAAGVLNHAT